MKKEVIIANQPSWVLGNETVMVYVAKLGGHMAPVVFDRKSPEPLRPYFINPWHAENLSFVNAVEAPLRGDFFCMPFGEDSPFSDEGHPLHGETATAVWQFDSESHEDGISTLQISLETHCRPGKVEKRIAIKENQTVLYIQDRIHQFTGEMTMGHHATLSGQHHWQISTSPLLIGMTYPDSGAPYAGSAYSALQPGQTFNNLTQVPTKWKNPETTDCSVFPAREGFVDLVQVFYDPTKTPAWTAAVDAENQFLWFSLKDPRVLPSMVMWMENRGRHGSPWSGRNCCIGLEDVCAYLGEGKGIQAVEQVMAENGLPTRHTLTVETPFDVNYIEGVARIPEGFNRVQDISFGDGEITFTSDSGQQVKLAVDYDFLYSGKLDYLV